MFGILYQSQIKMFLINFNRIAGNRLTQRLIVLFIKSGAQGKVGS